VQLAVRAGARRLYLFHHDPDRTDEKLKALVERERASLAGSGTKLEVNAAREGEELVLETAKPR